MVFQQFLIIGMDESNIFAGCLGIGKIEIARMQFNQNGIIGQIGGDIAACGGRVKVDPMAILPLFVPPCGCIARA
jgi:hypothetical protein